MKKKLIIILCILITLFLVGFLLYKVDSIRFKFAYEYMNYVEYDNGKKIKISIPWDNKIDYVSNLELEKLLTSGTGILYFGYNTCPWCRNAIPVLIKEVTKNNINKIYYADIDKIDVSIVKEKLVEYLKNDETGKKILSVPDVYFIKDGKIIGHHIGTVESYRNPYKKMSQIQIDELSKIYSNLIKGME